MGAEHLPKGRMPPSLRTSARHAPSVQQLAKRLAVSQEAGSWLISWEYARQILGWEVKVKARLGEVLGRGVGKQKEIKGI